MDDVFRALSDPTRREIVRLLRAGDRTAGEIAAVFPLAKSTLSAHFALLRQAGLVSGTRRGQTIVYRLNRSPLHALIATVEGWLGSTAAQPLRTSDSPAPPAAVERPIPPAGPSIAARGRAGAGTRTSFLRTGLLYFAVGTAGAAGAARGTAPRGAAPN